MSASVDPGTQIPHPDWVRVRLTLGYDGSGYAGWARQPKFRTVQGEIELALSQVDDRIGSVVCAGRTDAGVHARGQVIHVDVPPDLWAHRGPVSLVRQLNQMIGPQIQVHEASAAPAGFDARFSALSRVYSYRLCDDPRHWDPLFRAWVVTHRRTLDVAAMARAATFLIGEHDYAAFCKLRPGASTVRKILRLEVFRDGRRRVVTTIEGDAFCHSMVRAIVGALVAVGEGRKDAEWAGRVLSAHERDPGVTVMPPHGLVLESVAYPADELVGERARQTRRRRVGPIPEPAGPPADDASAELVEDSAPGS